MADKDFFLQRDFNAEFRAAGADKESTGHVIEGLAAVYEQETRIGEDFTEVIRSGAFDKTDFSDVRLLVNHDMMGIPLARSRRNNKSDKPNTMQLTVDEKGVNITADLDTANNPQASSLYSAISRGDMDKMSFCFFVSPRHQKWTRTDDDKILREIIKVDKVIEVSAVNFPAYAGTNIQNKRSLDSDQRALEEGLKALESATEQKEEKPVDYHTRALAIQYGGLKK